MDKTISLPVDGNFGAVFGATQLAILTDRSSVADVCHMPDIKFTIEPSGAHANRLKPERDDWQQI